MLRRWLRQLLLRAAWAAALWGAFSLHTTPALAGHCATAAAAAYGYQAYTSYASYPAATYYAPAAISYTPVVTYQVPKVKYEVQEVIVPKAVKAYVSPDYFSSVQDHYRDRNLIDAVAGKTQEVLRLQEQLQALQQQIQRQQQPAYQPPPAAYPPAPPQQAPTPCDQRAQEAYQRGLREAQGAQGQQGYGQGSQAPAPYAPQAPAQQPGRGAAPPAHAPPQEGGGRREAGNGGESVHHHGGVPDGLQAVVQQSCLRCHGATKDEHGRGFDLRDLHAVSVDDRMESYAQVAAGDMPSKAAPLPREQQRLFREWYRMAKQSSLSSNR